MKKYFGTDGIRGVANGDLTPEVATRVGRASVRAVGGNGCRVVIGRDTRVSGKMLEAGLLAGLLAQGAQVHLAGIVPTPAVAYLTGYLEADLGIVISASHNPFMDNGIKVLGPEGLKLPDDIEKAIEEELESSNDGGVGGPVGHVQDMADASRLYVEHLLSCTGYDLSGYRVALDCANGASYEVAPSVFRMLGATVDTIGVEPDGRNINLECGSTHPDRLVELVRSRGAQMGFALDGDGDRCICVDETGGIRDGDYMMAIVASHLQNKGRLEPPMVVSTVMSNMGLYRALEEMGVRSVQVQVGDRYVLEEMQSSGALVGGEQSGHLIFLEHASTGDGTLTALLVAGVVLETGKSLSELAGVMKKYPQVLINVKSETGNRLEDGMPVWDLIARVELELGDNGRILVRSSGTEPLERVMVEADTEERARRIAEEIAGAIDRELNG